MRTSLRILLAAVALVASLREAGSAACASTCPVPPLAGAACTPDGCCSPCDAPVDCPLLDPTPQALLERVPSPPSSDPRAPAPVLLALPAGAFRPCEVPAPASTAEAAAGGVRPRAGPLWLLDRSLRL
jgi:hypothetical protein